MGFVGHACGHALEATRVNARAKAGDAWRTVSLLVRRSGHPTVLKELMHVLLDLDGTLTDPREGIVGCIRHALEKMGHPPPPNEELARYNGPPLHEGYADILKCTDKARIDHAVALYRE